MRKVTKKREGVNKSKTFAAVVKFTSSGIVLLILVPFGKNLPQMTVLVAILYRKLQEEVFRE